MEMSDKIRNATAYTSWNALLDVTDEETWNAILITTFNATRIATEVSTLKNYPMDALVVQSKDADWCIVVDDSDLSWMAKLVSGGWRLIRC